MRLTIGEYFRCKWLKFLFFFRYKIKKRKIVGAYLICPKCGRISVCPCETCKELREQAGVTYYKEHTWKKGEYIVCPYCGFTGHIDYWCFFSEECFNNRNF